MDMSATGQQQQGGRLRLPPPRVAVPNGGTRPTEPTYNDTYVVAYDFGGVDYDAAAKEFSLLLDSLEAAGLHVEVRPSFEKTILVFVKAPEQLLGNTVYKSRVRDWLYSITQNRPEGDKDTVVRAWYEAEDLLAMHHLVAWPKELGGAGITPETGRWENVKAIFPLHNERDNQVLLRHLSRRLVLTNDDFDKIRDLLGAKVAFYFAFIQTYLMFLTFPAITGVLTWLFLSQYSLAYAILTSIWCSVFLEYWKVQELDLSIRWKTRGVNKSKTNRPEFKYDSVLIDAHGRTRHHFPKWKHITRQLLQIPFIVLATVVLGAIICCVFAVEILISEAYDGPYQFYLEYLPTVLLAVAIPYMSSSLEGIAEALTQYENHRTADQHEMSLTQKIFLLNIITNYLPILLTAFVYVPYGHIVVPSLKRVLQRLLPSLSSRLSAEAFRSDPNRLRNEVIALTVTGQISSFFEENFLPLIKHKFLGWHRAYRRAHSKDAMLLRMTTDDAEEVEFLKTCRNQGTLPQYNVQDDIAEIVLQFGYLALFAPVWPLISLGFLINNWIELRSDFAKICFEHRRPAPTRADGIGPWVQSLEMLTWLGSIITAAMVHLFGSDGHKSHWATLPVTVFISEHILLVLRSLARWVFERFGSEQIRRERDERYARRLSYLDNIEANRQAGLHLSPAEKERRKSVLVLGADSFWRKQVDDGMSAAAGLRLINMAKEWDAEHADVADRKKK